MTYNNNININRINNNANNDYKNNLNYLFFEKIFLNLWKFVKYQP